MAHCSGVDAAIPRAVIRQWCLFAATLAWLWATSVFVPWAADMAPRLWLYDLLFYLRFVLLGWAALELLMLARRKTTPASSATRWLPLASTAVLVVAAWTYDNTAVGLRLKLSSSRLALAAAASDGYSDKRRRVGHFLVDTARTPCMGDATWLWLGQPFGGGSGTNMALVVGRTAPSTPATAAFAFWSIGDGWWLAYQHAEQYRNAMQGASAPASCGPGIVVPGHRDGLALIADGRQRLQHR